MSFTLIVLSIAAAAAAGLFVKFLLDYFKSESSITWKEYITGMRVISIILAPSVTWIGWKVAKSNNMSFNEYQNGWETEAVWEETACDRDGSCRYAYNCDPYTETDTYTECDSDGRCELKTRTETKYHSCPYSTKEWHFKINTTLGQYVIGLHHLPDNPQEHRWRSGVAIPSSVIERAGAGMPDFWVQAFTRIKQDSPGPVTKRASYENYLLVSDADALRELASLIEHYKNEGLFPAMQKDVYNFYYANKVYFVGYQPTTNQWQNSLMYLNAAIGARFGGDLHLVIVQNDLISGNPDGYTLALKAYWQDKRIFGDNTFSKNGILVVLGTKNGETLDWARAVTGMPAGNEKMIDAIQNLNGLSMNPDAIIGYNKGGALSSIILGLDDSSSKFSRVNMEEFSYLTKEIKPTKRQQFWIVVITFLICMLVWFVTVIVGERSWRHQY